MVWNNLRIIGMDQTLTQTQGPEAAQFLPIRIIDLELNRTIPGIPAQDPVSGKEYRRVRLLVRLHEHLLGVIDLEIGVAGLNPQEVADQVWASLSGEINQHLLTDGLPAISELGSLGLLDEGDQPRCIRELDAFLQNAPFASVVIATHNRTESLAETISSLLDMVYPRFEIIVVDNAPSSGETINFIQQNYPGDDLVRYVREDYPGLSVAHNCGLKAVSAPYVAFTDDDVILDRYWLANLIRGFHITENVGCVTGMIMPYEIETPAQAWIEQYGGFSKGFQPRVFDLEEHRIDHPLYPYAAGWFGSGASMAFKTDILTGLGGFDPATGAGTLAMGGDDLAAFFQVVSEGYRLVYEPNAVLFHKHRREYAGLLRQAYGYGVGLTAFLTKAVFDRPRRLLTLASRIPAGLAYLFGAQSNKNAKKLADYPVELNRLERQGMLYGPIAYLRSRQRAKDAGLYSAIHRKAYTYRLRSDSWHDPRKVQP
jgi:GT2 family glycosyltransferase